MAYARMNIDNKTIRFERGSIDYNTYMSYKNMGYNVEMYDPVPAATSLVSSTLMGKAEEPKKEIKMFKKIKESYEKHSDVINLVIACFLVDHFVFEGKFRTKLEGLFENLLAKLTGMVAPSEKSDKQ